MELSQTERKPLVPDTSLPSRLATARGVVLELVLDSICAVLVYVLAHTRDLLATVVDFSHDFES